MEKAKTGELLKWDCEHLIHSMSPLGSTRGVVFDTAEGIILRDTEGKEYIDSCSQLVNVNIGHGRKEVIEAIVEQLGKLQYTTTYYGFTNTAAVLCAKKLAEITPPGLKHFFFTSGGSESVETAFKIARNYWHAKKPEKHKIISLYNCFHGVSFGTLSATNLGMGRLWKSFGPLVPDSCTSPRTTATGVPSGWNIRGAGLRAPNFWPRRLRMRAGTVWPPSSLNRCRDLSG